MKGKKVLGVAIAFFVFVAFVLIAGNTYVTASGIWLGYGWHPINSSEGNDASIKTGKASVGQMNDIVEMIHGDGSISNRMSGDGYETIRKINRVAKIKEFREIYYNGNNSSYCVYENDKGGKFVVTFYRLSAQNKKEINDNCIPDGAFYLEKKLRFEDFKEINVGSAKQDIMKIDPATDVNMKYNIEGELLETTETESIHITKEGYVYINYDENGIVTEITENESDMIQKVMAAEF
ncbi:MAG: hypothetical protein J1E62_00695 [Lachnospiraceae bacterium]|nr:hypothetical protein [Lachnospiraceae bacterium]